VVHRDVKPANLLVTTQGGREHVRVADFGLARVYQTSQLSGLTMTGTVGGTPAFMAPEQLTNYRGCGPAADQYSAAATLYHLLTGALTHDFQVTIRERLAQLLRDDPIPIQQRRPDVPDELARALHRALTRDPTRRYPDVRAFRRAVSPFAG
jgi:serine/threonine-protein kinase